MTKSKSENLRERAAKARAGGLGEARDKCIESGKVQDARPAAFDVSLLQPLGTLQ